MRALVHPSFDPYYYGYFVEGLRAVVGEANITFTHRGFPNPGSDIFAKKDTMLVLIEDGSRLRRLYISADDHDRLSRSGLDWADVYAKVNVGPTSRSEAERAGVSEKLVPIGPTFGVKAWSGLGLFRMAAKIPGRVHPDFVPHYLRELYRQRRRRRFGDYRFRSGSRDYIFFVAWGWKKHREVNDARAAFVRVCQDLPGVEFEGGFAPRPDADSLGIADILAPRVYSHSEYLARMSRSLLAFNTPAVHDCLGWKLGEFFALGKAIVSLPLTRELPGSVEPGEHYVLVKDPVEVPEVIARLRNDGAYRRALERNARRYFEDYLAPPALMQRLIATARAN